MGLRTRAFAIPLLLWVSVVAVHPHGQMGCSDSRWSVPTAVSLLDQGNFDLDEYLPVIEARGFYFTEQVRGHYYTVYPFGTSILAAPAVAVLRPIFGFAFRAWPSLRGAMERAADERGCPPAAGEPVISLHSWTEQIVASAIVGTTTVLIYAIARTELGPAGAALLALVFAFGTSAWSTASRSLWQHGPSMLILALALLGQIRRWPMAVVGMLLGFGYVVRPTNVIPLAATLAWVAYERPRTLWKYALGAAAILVPFLALNQHVYGAWLSEYYHPSRFHGNPFFWDAFAGLIISPGRGLLIYSPVLIFSAAGAALKIRQRRFTALDASIAATMLLYWLVNAQVNEMWWGGDSYGPRFFSDMLPYQCYWLVPFVAWLGRATGAARTPAASAFAAAILVSVLMHAQGVFNRDAVLWNWIPQPIDRDEARLWDWRHPPFLAGLLAPLEAAPPADLRAVPCDAPPGQPGGFALVSSGRYGVTAAWTASSGAVVDYVIDVGSAPGLTDLPAREVRAPETQVTVSRVPPGTYYARVRGRNACGMSAPSNEITVTVK